MNVRIANANKWEIEQIESAINHRNANSISNQIVWWTNKKKRIITKGNWGSIEQIRMCLQNFHRKKALNLSIMEMKDVANDLVAVVHMCVLSDPVGLALSAESMLSIRLPSRHSLLNSSHRISRNSLWWWLGAILRNLIYFCKSPNTTLN